MTQHDTIQDLYTTDPQAQSVVIKQEINGNSGVPAFASSTLTSTLYSSEGLS